MAVQTDPVLVDSSSLRMVPAQPYPANSGRLGAFRWTIFCGVDDHKLLVGVMGMPSLRGGENATYACIGPFRPVLAGRACFWQLLPSSLQFVDVEPFGSSGDEWVLRKTDDWMHFQSAVDLIDLDQWTWLKNISQM